MSGMKVTVSSSTSLPGKLVGFVHFLYFLVFGLVFLFSRDSLQRVR